MPFHPPIRTPHDTMLRWRLVAWGGVVLLTAACSTSSRGPDLLPRPAPPRHAVVFDATRSSPEMQNLLTSLQGAVARTEPEIFLVMGRGDDQWLSDLQETYGMPVETVDDPWALLARFRRSVRGAVVYSGPSTNAAQTVADALGALMVERSLASSVEEQGIPVRMDVTGWTDRRALATYPDLLGPSPLFMLLPQGTGGGRDYAAFTRGFVFFDPLYRDDLMAALDWEAQETDHQGHLWGWGDPAPLEDTWVRPGSQRGLTTIPAGTPGTGGPKNISFLAGVRAAIPGSIPSTPTFVPGVHTVAFLMSDGDNVAMNLEYIPVDPDLFASPLRGTFPVGWTISPLLTQLAPTVLAWYKRHASPEDLFVSGVSGMGYFYPDLHPDLARHVARLGPALAAADLHVVDIMVYKPAGFQPSVVAPYAALPEVHGGLVLSYFAGYDNLHGKVLWSNGKPFVSARYAMCKACSISQLGPDGVAAALNALPADPSTEDGYSFIIVQNFSYGLSGVQACIRELGPQVRVVRPDALLALMAAHVAHP